MSSVVSALAQLVAVQPVVVFGTPVCKHCGMLKQFFATVGVEYAFHDILTLKDGDAIFEEITRTTGGHDTTPACYIHGKFVGGNSDVQALHQEGKLLPMISKNTN